MTYKIIKPIKSLLHKMYQIYSELFDGIFHWIFGAIKIDYEKLNYNYE